MRQFNLLCEHWRRKAGATRRGGREGTCLRDGGRKPRGHPTLPPDAQVCTTAAPAQRCCAPVTQVMEAKKHVCQAEVTKAADAEQGGACTWQREDRADTSPCRLSGGTSSSSSYRTASSRRPELELKRSDRKVEGRKARKCSRLGAGKPAPRECMCRGVAAATALPGGCDVLHCWRSSSPICKPPQCY